jgi:hypothetical protein
MANLNATRPFHWMNPDGRFDAVWPMAARFAKQAVGVDTRPDGTPATLVLSSKVDCRRCGSRTE